MRKLPFYKNETWELVKKPINRRVVRCKWIFKIKESLIRPEPKRFKARLIAERYIQKERVDFKEVFSPIVRHASIRVILALTIVEDMKHDQLDVKTALLYSKLKKEILIFQHERYENSKKKDHV